MMLSDTPFNLLRTDHKISISVDYPNMEIGLKESDWPMRFDYEVIEKFAKPHGEIISSRIYGDWNYLYISKVYLSQYDVELVHVPHVKSRAHIKDTVDTKLAVDVGMMLYEQSNVDLVIIVSGDADFIPVMETCKKHGDIKTVIIGEKDSISQSLKRIADLALSYQDIAQLD